MNRAHEKSSVDGGWGTQSVHHLQQLDFAMGWIFERHKKHQEYQDNTTSALDLFLKMFGMNGSDLRRILF